MSNIRDLQKLKGTRPIQPLSNIPHRLINPELNNLHYDPPSLHLTSHKPIKSTYYGKDSLQATNSKIIHKRGASFGTA